MAVWTLQYNGVEKTLAEWGLTDVARTRRSATVWTVTLMADGRAVDATELFGYGSTVIILRDGVRWFYGRVEPWERSGGPESEAHFGRLVCPWWYLTQLMFEQAFMTVNGATWTGAAGTSPGFQPFYTTHVFLNFTTDTVNHPNGKLTTGEQIREILQWAIDNGAPMQIGTISPDADVWIDEDKNITCEGAIQKMLAWTLDAITEWDMTTLPYPTLHIRRVGELQAVAVDVNGGRPTNELRIKERPDWLRPFVRILFEQECFGFLEVIEDAWPQPLPATKFGGLIQTLNLMPVAAQQQTAQIVCQPIAPNNLGWWQDRRPELAGLAAVAGLAGPGQIQFVGDWAVQCLDTDSSGSPAAWNPACTNELTGTLAPWMTGVIGQKARVSIQANIREANGHTTMGMLLYHDCTLTNASTGNYSKLNLSQYGEPVPFGMARELWQALDGLAAEGTLTRIDQEIEAAFDQWKVLNFITAARPDWATLRALPQQITDTIRTGTTSIQFGAPDHLQPNQLLALNRVARSRNIQFSFSMRSGGSVGSGAAPALPNKTDGVSSQKAGGFVSRQVISGSADGSTGGAINHDTADCEGKTLRIGRIHFPDQSTGNPMRMLAAHTPPEADPDTGGIDPNDRADDVWIGSGMRFRGEWIDTQNYVEDDVVLTSRGLWIASDDNTGSNPDNVIENSPWTLLVGGNVRYRGQFNVAAYYYVNDLVFTGTASARMVWLCEANCIGNTPNPTADGAPWRLLGAQNNMPAPPSGLTPGWLVHHFKDANNNCALMKFEYWGTAPAADT